MKFTGEGNTIVWDPERQRELCRFTKGSFETEDPRTCNLLVKLGYTYEGELPKQEKPQANPSTEDDEQLEQLRAQAKELRVRNWHTMKREGLEKAIAAVLEKVQQ